MNDDAVIKMRIEMMQAADQDIEENRAGRPAVYKMRMLPAVVEMMQKSVLWFSSVDTTRIDNEG